MDDFEAIAALSAFAQATRWEIFRELVRSEPQGLPVGELARLMETPQNTLSAHLGILSRSGLVTSERRNRSIIYRTNLARFGQVAVFLLKDCCDGRPDVCAPLVIDLLAVPIVIQVYSNAGLVHLLSRALGVEWCVAGPSALIGASNFFELAVARAFALFGF